MTVEIPDGSFKRPTPACKGNGEGTPESLCPAVDRLSETFLRHLISFLRHLKSIGLCLSPGKTLDILKGMEWIRIG